MATDSIGQLTVTLGANSAQLVSELQKTNKRSRAWAKDLKKNSANAARFTDDVTRSTRTLNVELERTTSLSTKAGAAVATMFAVQAGAALGYAVNLSDAVREQEAWAKMTGTSLQTMQEWSYAAKTLGKDSEYIGDVFKDTAEKIGDFVNTGGGEAKDVFERLKLSVEDLAGLSPDQQILTIGNALSQLQTQGEKIAIMDKLANDASLLIPLLENNAQGLRELQKEANKIGAIVSPDEARKLRELSDSWTKLTETARAFGKEVSTTYADDMSSSMDALSEALVGVQDNLDTIKAVGVPAVGALAAVMSGRMAGAISEVARERLTEVAATQKSLSANKLAAAQSLRSAEIALRQAQAERQQAANAVAHGQAIKAQTGSTVLLTNARNRLAASTQALRASETAVTAATAQYTAAAGAASVATRGLQSAMAFLGGPVGVVITAVTAFALLRPELETSRERIKGLAEEAANGADKINALARSTNNLSIMQQQAKLFAAADAIEEQRKKAEETRKEIERLHEAENSFNIRNVIQSATLGMFGLRDEEFKAANEALIQYEANIVNGKNAYKNAKRQLDETFASQEKFNNSLAAGRSEAAGLTGTVQSTAKSYAELKGAYDNVTKANNAYYASVNEIMKADASLAQKQELIAAAAKERSDAVKEAATKRREEAAATKYQVSAYHELLGQYDQMQKIQNDYTNTLREIESAELTAIQRKKLMAQADNDRVAALRKIKAEQVSILESRIKGGQDTGAVDMNYINRTGDHAPDLKSSRVFEQAARRLSDTIERGNLDPTVMGQAIQHLQTMVSRYSGSDGYDVRGMQGVVENLAAKTLEAFKDPNAKPMTAKEYAEVFKQAQERAAELREKQENAYDTIVKIDEKIGLLAENKPKNLGSATLTVKKEDGSPVTGDVTGDEKVMQALLSGVLNKAKARVA